MSKPLIGLVMVVKDEAQQIERCLESAKPLIDTYTICDTGSTDDTIARVKKVMHGVPGHIHRHKWRNFGDNLTLAHKVADDRSRWTLWLHADMTVHFVPEFRPWLAKQRTKLEHTLTEVTDHGIHYPLPLLKRTGLPWRYVGATHEYLDLDPPRKIRTARLQGFYVIHHGDGGSKADKLTRDIELLKPGLIAGEPRATFYTAESYRYLGQTREAIHCYKMRANMDGWEEERWYSRFQVAALERDIPGLIAVQQERPWRPEPFLAAARITAENYPGAGGDLLFLEDVR